jgi:thiol-disulfide isomerase/thioredoxin
LKRPEIRIAAAVMACATLALLPAQVSAKPITITPIDASGLKKAIGSEKGHVVVVNFWATWCIPCVQEFPTLVTIQRRYGRDGLVVFAVSADVRRDVAGKVLPFLRRQHADFPQYLQHSKDPQDFIDAFDPSWYGDLPRTFIYDRSGHLVKELTNGQTERSFATAVVPLLRQ